MGVGWGLRDDQAGQPHVPPSPGPVRGKEKQGHICQCALAIVRLGKCTRAYVCLYKPEGFSVW